MSNGTPDQVGVTEVKGLLSDPNHWVYSSPGTPSDLGPDSVFHVGQVEVLLEDKLFHWRTNAAIGALRASRDIVGATAAYSTGQAQMFWRRNVRYTSRKEKEHVSLLAEYSSQTMSKACGDYCETLTRLGLVTLGMQLVDRNSRRYRGRQWTTTGHDLDFILEHDGRGYGAEVKNTFAYMPSDEFDAKIEMCKYLGLRPLFMLRTRHSAQWQAARAEGGLVYVFKTKVFPPGQEDLAQRIWRHMRLPVAVYHDWPQRFYNVVGSFLTSSADPTR